MEIIRKIESSNFIWYEILNNRTNHSRFRSW